MRTTLANAAILTALLLAACAGDPLAPEPRAEDAVRARLLPATRLCILLDDERRDELADVAATHGLTVIESFGGGRLALVLGVADPQAFAMDERIVAYQADGFTALSRPVELTMSFYEGDFQDQLPGQDALRPLELDRVHALGRGRGVRVAVLDTGADPTHPLLAGRLETIPEGASQLGSLEIAAGVDTDGDGQVDEAFGHGTHVAGLIAAVAPEATILPIRVLDSDGVGTAFELAMGILRAAELGADVINLSLVLSDETEVIERVLRDLDEAGVIVVGAAGNVPGQALFPASDSHVLSVAALDHSLGLASFSAGIGVRVGAPGETVVSAFPGGRWASATGTSMACAITSGAMAVLVQLTHSVERAESLLRTTAAQLEPMSDGRIDLLRAAFLAADRPVPPRVQVDHAP